MNADERGFLKIFATNTRKTRKIDKNLKILSILKSFSVANKKVLFEKI